MSDKEIKFVWNPKELEIKTRTVELALEPLVVQVTTLLSAERKIKKKGKSKRAKVLVEAVERATTNFVENGKAIATENPEVENEMLAAVDEVMKAGNTMSATAREFANDPFSSVKREDIVRAARALLSSVTRLLTLADLLDVHKLLTTLQQAEADLENLKLLRSKSQLSDGITQFGRSAVQLINEAGRRQHDLRDPIEREDIAGARAILRKYSTMLLTSGKAYIKHPDLSAAQGNRDFVIRQVAEAIHTIRQVVKGQNKRSDMFGGIGELLAAIDNFDSQAVMDPMRYNDSASRQPLEEQLESIISGAALMADSSSTRDERRDKIVAECNNVRQALQDLLAEYVLTAGKRPGPELSYAVDFLHDKTRDLRRQLRKAIVDHVSDSFLEEGSPLHLMIEAAKTGNERAVDDYGQMFSEHAHKLVEVANLACSMSDNEEGVKMVRYAAQQIQNLYNQVINAARILTIRPNSKAAHDNMEVFKRAWEEQVKTLTDAVDDIVTIGDFLAVSENHILEDVRKCCSALKEGDAEFLQRVAGSVQGRSSRIGDVVVGEMDNYEPGLYTERVLQAVRMLRSAHVPHFSKQVDLAVDALLSMPVGPIDENEFIDASRLVYDGVREIRRAVLLSTGNDNDSDPDWEEADEYIEAIIEEDIVDEYPDIDGFGIDTAIDAMKQLPEEEKVKIAEHVEQFRTEQIKFDKEVAKWDENGNDLIVLAKDMCIIMMEMTDFTRGKGRLKTTTDMINAAKKISEAGTKLDKVARMIADQCPESTTKKDLLAYLQRIALYCHQLNITSKVKADVQNVSGELVVSGLDSATSLLQAAKNLISAVVLTVKASYVASTKYKKADDKQAYQKPVVIWRMKAPEKKALVRKEVPEEAKAKIRRGPQQNQMNPLKVLKEFHRPISGSNV